jgi:hypothetical protein
MDARRTGAHEPAMPAICLHGRTTMNIRKPLVLLTRLPACGSTRRRNYRPHNSERNQGNGDPRLESNQQGVEASAPLPEPIKLTLAQTEANTAHGSKVVMLQYRTNWCERRKPKIGQFGELTVEQARSIAQDWLADVRKGNGPWRRPARGPGIYWRSVMLANGRYAMLDAGMGFMPGAVTLDDCRFYMRIIRIYTI